MRVLACSGSGCGSSTEATTLGLGGAAIAALLLLIVAVRRIRQARRLRDPLLAVIAAVFAGLAVFFAGAFFGGLRTYDGTAGGARYRCEPWWQEASVPDGEAGVAGDTGPCRQRAVDATVPALGVAAVAGIVVGLAAGGALALDRRRART